MPTKDGHVTHRIIEVFFLQPFPSIIPVSRQVSSAGQWGTCHIFVDLSLHHAVYSFTDVSRVGLTVSYFFLVSRNTKLYETGHYFAEFRSFRETKKNYENTKKSVSSCFAKLKKPFRFVVTV